MKKVLIGYLAIAIVASFISFVISDKINLQKCNESSSKIMIQDSGSKVEGRLDFYNSLVNEKLNSNSIELLKKQIQMELIYLKIMADTIKCNTGWEEELTFNSNVTEKYNNLLLKLNE